MRKMLRLVGMLVALTMVATVFLTACGQDAEDTGAADEKFKVGFVYVGPIGDAGWTYAHDVGRLYMEEMLPNVESIYVESVPEGADAERVIADLAEKGCKAIFTTSFGYMDATINVAKNYPDVHFFHCSGYKRAENVSTYFGREHQSRYLAGIAAGAMTKSGKLGYVGAFPIPEVVRGINAFTLGVQEVNPDAVVKVVWTNTWYDPAKEKEAALSLLDQGCDVIAQHQDSPACQQAAQERGAYAVGNDSDMRPFAPEANLTSPLFIWGPYYVEAVTGVMEGTWESSDFWGGYAEGTTDLAPLADFIPQNIKDLIAAKKAEITQGEFDMFVGPITDQAGTLRVAEGVGMTDEEILSFDWFVKGVEGSVPK